MKERPYHQKLLRFLLAGGPAFLLAIPLNYFLAHQLGLNKAVAYALVLSLQTVVNFLMVRAFVFESSPETGLFKSFLIFLNGNIFFRLADLGLYYLLTEYAHTPIIVAQLFNVILFSFLKFEFTKRVLERKK
jgi:putative flippase GtrA